MTHAKRRRLWQTRVTDYYASGLTKREWCEGTLDFSCRQAFLAADSDTWPNELL